MHNTTTKDQNTVARRCCAWCRNVFVPGPGSFGAFCARACGDAEMAAPRRRPVTARDVQTSLRNAGIPFTVPTGRAAQHIHREVDK